MSSFVTLQLRRPDVDLELWLLTVYKWKSLVNVLQVSPGLSSFLPLTKTMSKDGLAGMIV